MGNCVSNQEGVRQANRVTPLSLTVKHFTWTRDSHGLFDYENKHMIKGQIKTNAGAIRMVRTKDIVKIIQTRDELNQLSAQVGHNELLKVQRQFFKYILETGTKLSTAEDQEGLAENCAWVVVKSSKSQLTNQQGYDLKEGDYVKLGRVRFRIREIKTGLPLEKSDLQIPELQKFVSEKCLNMITINTEEDDQQSQGEEPQCRICYNDSLTNSENPLVNCCKCQGSMKYIHIQCLQKWLSNKLLPKTTKFSVSFQWKQFECEVCKAPIPSRVRFQDRIYETIVIPKPEIPYITIEILSRDRNQSKGTHIISFAQKTQIKLGRGHESDVRITDISVSRCHAIIKYANPGFVLEDQQSKFGTLVLMKNQTAVTLDNNNNMALQIGRSVISFQVSKDWNVQTCCMAPIMDEEPTNEEENELIGHGVGDDDQQGDMMVQVEEQSPV